MMTLTPDFFTDTPDVLAGEDAEPIYIVSDDPVCEVCGDPLTYSGRGRKPKYCDEHKRTTKSAPRATSAKGSTRDVTAAQNTLKTLNGLIAVPLMMTAPNAGAQWGEHLPALEAHTLTILEADPVLAKRLASVGGKGGVISLALAYGMALIPVMGTARMEMEQRREQTWDSVDRE